MTQAHAKSFRRWIAAAALAATTPPVPVSPAKSPVAAPSGIRRQGEPTSPLAVSRALAEALNVAAHYHVQFWLADDGLLVTQPPRDYRREVQAAERALMERREEIKMICGWPRRPKGYTDANWVRAVVDSCRLGYNLWREGDR